MSQYSINDELTMLEGSLCVSCEHLISRTIQPLNYEDYDIDPDDIVMDDGTEAPIVHNACIALNMDLDHIVLNCNKYIRLKKKIIDDIFIKKLDK